MVDAYVRRQLARELCAAFEEHYFQCARCLDDIQMTEKLVQGVEHAVRSGLLDSVAEAKPARGWWMPAFAFASALAVVLAIALALVVFVQQPAREARLQQETRNAVAHARASEARAAELAAQTDRAEANVPVVILTASRSTEPPNQVEFGPQARRALLWIDVSSQPAGTRFGITLASADGRIHTSVHDLQRNSSGALAASLPVAVLAAGRYSVRLFNEKSPEQTIAEYRLTVGRR